MTIGTDWVVLDTNVWIFGLREQSDKLECAYLLRHLPRLQVHVPRQILLELGANLADTEMRDLFRLFARFPERIKVSWERVEDNLIHKYIGLGCKLGDAVVAAHTETVGIRLLVSENRDFLEEISDLPFRVLTASDALKELQEQLELS